MKHTMKSNVGALLIQLFLPQRTLANLLHNFYTYQQWPTSDTCICKPEIFFLTVGPYLAGRHRQNTNFQEVIPVVTLNMAPNSLTTPHTKR